MSASDEAPDAAEPSLEVALHESPFGTAWCAKSPTGARQLARVVPTRTPVGRHDVAQLRQRFARAADLQAPQLLPAIDVIERAREVVSTPASIAGR